MARGRKRKHNPDIPKHIDQAKIPAGIYWEPGTPGYWYAFDRGEDGKPKRVKVAKATAYLSDLHAVAEAREGRATKGTVAAVMEAFERSTRWRELSQASRDDYTLHARLVRDWKGRDGLTFGQRVVDRLSQPAIHALVEAIAKGKPESAPGAGDGVKGRPSTANHALRYLRRLFAWGIVAGECKTNPASGVPEVKERKRNTMPARDVLAKMIAFARVAGARPRRTKGAVPPYLAPIIEIAYLCRLRSAEAVALTDWHARTKGVIVQRVKGSNGNLTLWNDRLRAAWDEARAVRAALLKRLADKGRARPTPIRPEDRFLFLSESGEPLSTGALKQAVADLRAAAIAEGIIPPGTLFSMHGLKHRGVTDTRGNKGDKRDASGHRQDATLAVYDHELPVVAPAEDADLQAEFYGEFYGGHEKGVAQ